MTASSPHSKLQRAPFRIAAASTAAFRVSLRRKGFVEIQTPKVVVSATESGANVFALDYFGRPAYLAQSPRFYKQVMVGVLERVFEVQLEEDWLLLHTDGVSARAEVETLPSFARRDPSALANDVLRGWARETDDATVVVASPGVLAGSGQELP